MNSELLTGVEQGMKNVRDVRTLLFCRTSKNNEERDRILKSNVRTHNMLYEEIRNLRLQVREDERETFFALGSFDALHVYKTPIAVSGPNWFYEVYKDKQRIVQNITTDLIFHQMHMVKDRRDSDNFWSPEAKRLPFFLATCIYGVQHEKKELKTEDERDDTENLYCSTYEYQINKLLKKLCDAVDPSRKTLLYSVYNGISISDVIVLWRTSDLQLVLNLVPQIELCGKARKTLTTISFPMSKNGQIRDDVYDALECMDNSCGISLSVRGSIRSASRFTSVRNKLKSILNTPHSYQNFGLNDFTIEADVTGAVIADLLRLYTNNHDEISNCCWEIHTDLRCKDTFHASNSMGPDYPASILYREYNRFLKYCSQYSLDRYPWCHALRELYATNSNIDRNPVLHGPSYLVYYTLRIANDFFSNSVKDFENEDKVKSLLLVSERKLLRFVRSWDQLTEQIIRNDDVILGGRNNSHTVHISLPESALDFYHAYLRKTVKFLVQCDTDNGRTPESFLYDFLLVPDINTRFHFSQIFVTNTDQKSFDKHMNKVWPERQAYLLNIPLDSIFSPMEVLIPVTHECFHCFGDVLRKRERRRQYMAMFIAMDLISAMNFGGSSYKLLHKHVALMVYGKINNYSSYYMDRACVEMYENAKNLLGAEGSKRIFEELPTAYFLFSDKALQSTLKISDSSSWDTGKSYSSIQAVVKCAKYFFKECYADAMTIALLDLTPSEYLKMFRKEIVLMDFDNNCGRNESDSRKHNRDNLCNVAIIAQRIAIVMAACNAKENDISYFGDDACLEAISEISEWAKDSFDGDFHYANTYKIFSEGIRIVYDALMSPDLELGNRNRTGRIFDLLCSDSENAAFFDTCSPPASLKYVQDYLEETMQGLFVASPKVDTIADRKTGKKLDYYFSVKQKEHGAYSLAEDFASIIRNGNMFGRRFYDFIYEYHDEIKDTIKNSV